MTLVRRSYKSKNNSAVKEGINMNNNKTLKTLNEILYENEKKWADVVYLRQPIHGKWHTYTWRETMLRARKMAAFLKSIGLQKGDRVAIFSKNCAEWFMADFAIALGGFVSIPLFAAQHSENIRYVLTHAEVKAIFVGKLDNWTLQEPAIDKDIPRIAFPYEGGMPAQYSWDDIINNTEPQTENYIPDLEDIYTIIYTSGTTGNPKGAVIPFKAFAYAARTYEKEIIFSTYEHNILFSYLPLGHIFERVAIEYSSVLSKSTVSFCESLAMFSQNLKDTSPTHFIAVPRIWMQFQKGILAKLSQRKLDILLNIPIINRLIKRKIRAGLGLTNAEFICSGSAPLSPHILEWYSKLGIIICEGYGRTEDLAILTINYPDDRCIGSVGKVRPEVEIKIDDNGEILTRSKSIMSGYYKDPEATSKVFTEDGYMRTGDKGHFDKDGYLIISGRISDTFKTDKGEFINPALIESQFLANSFIEQICLIGLNLSQPIVLVVLSEAAKTSQKEIIVEHMQRGMETINRGLARHERVSHIIIVNEHWTPENNLLTPTMKMKRHLIHEKFITLAHKISSTEELVIFEDHTETK